MKILVPIKRVPDYQSKVRVKADGSGIETEGIKWIVNPFDEIAVEEALRLKEAGKATDVVVVSVGPQEVTTQMRYAMAMGADSGILVHTDGVVDSDLAARALVEVFKRGTYGLIILGKQAIDSDCNQTGQLMAARLGLAQGCFASKVVLESDHALVTREVDGGLETLKLPLPCVITTDLRLNEPRDAPLPGIMKAKKKPLEEIKLSDLGLDANLKLTVLKMTPPGKRQAGRKLESIEELVKVLQNEVKAI